MAILFFLLLLGCYALARYCTAIHLGFVQGILYYYIGAVICLKDKVYVDKGRNIFFAFLFVIGWIFYVILNNIHINNGIISNMLSLIGITIFGTMASIGLFVLFIRFRRFNVRIINIFASSTLAVYLLHENPLLRKFWWTMFCT